MTPPPDELDRRFVLRVVVGAVVIGLLVAVLGSAVWLAVARFGSGPPRAPSGTANATPSSAGSSVASSASVAATAGGSPGATGSGPVATPSPTLSPPTTAGRETVVSAPTSPFSTCATGGAGTVSLNSEVEPWIAVDPAAPDTFVAAWQQDRWANGASHGIVVARSTDTGGTWSTSTPAFSGCAAPDAGVPTRASDPWVSFGRDGVAYTTSLSVTQPNETWVVSARSTDAGRSWPHPVAITKSESARVFNDKESVTADPRVAGRAYVVWDRSGGGESESNEGGGGTGSVVFASTRDAGAHWSAARTIATLDGTPVGNVIVVTPDATLLDVFVLAPRDQQALPREMALRSTDGGATWSEPITVAQLASRGVIGAQAPGIRGGGGLPAPAVDPTTGDVFVTWTDAVDGVPALQVTSSADGGRTWAVPTSVPRPRSAPVFLPSIAVTAHGTVGVEYTDLRAATAADSTLADRFLATSTDHGKAWAERRLTSTFDFGTAPNASARFLGDYSGLAVSGERFVSIYSVTTGSGADPTSLVVRVDPADESVGTP